MIPLSSETRVRIRYIFAESNWHEVEAYLLNECGDNLPLVDASHAELVERIRFAVLKCSDGDFRSLKRLVEKAKQDWRDTLMAAGFGENDAAHLMWQPSE